MKPRIFIGSSKESLEVVKKIESRLNGEFDFIRWNENFYLPNSATYYNLAERAIAFDYAIFVGGKDDRVIRINEGTEKISPRDNVYLEFGLYAGILTPARTFFVFHKECGVASDLRGITLFVYETDEELDQCCNQIRKTIGEEEQISRFSFLPSTSLAFGYFENFIKPISQELFGAETIRIHDRNYKIGRYIKILEIVIPSDLETNLKSWAEEYYRDHELENAYLHGTIRNFGIRIDKKVLINEGKAHIYDIPLTLKSSFQAVQNVMKKDFIGTSDDERVAKEREVVNFIRTLKILINQDGHTKKIVKITRS